MPSQRAPFHPSLPGRAHRVALAAGHHIVLYRLDEGRHSNSATPLLAVHSVNAAASAYEMLPLVVAQARTRPVVALDLPGFGASDRPDIAYTPQAMTEAVLTAARWMGAEIGPRPVDLVALSLGGEFATQAVLQQPQAFRSLALISPTGMEARRDHERYEDGRTREQATVRRILRSGALGRGLYRALTRRGSMRWFLSRTWGGGEVDPGLLEQAVLCSRQPGAHHAPLDFISGALFTRGIVERYRALPLPLWVAHGNRGSFTDFGACPNSSGNRVHRHVVQRTEFDSGAMPHFELPEVFADAYERFLARRFVEAAPLAPQRPAPLQQRETA